MSRVGFKDATYRSQVSRLRAVALEALTHYPLRVESVKFIHHGENTTFKVTGTWRGSRLGVGRAGAGAYARDTFLLRVHRLGYHTRAAIGEELRWLSRLAGSSVVAPLPLRARGGELLLTIARDDVDGPRHCDLLRWVEGRFVDKRVTPAHFAKIGALLATLHKSTARVSVRSRRYWTADGLLAADPKMGDVRALPQVTRAQQKFITGLADRVRRELRSFERKHPSRMGLIHADLHFGNFVVCADGSVAPIDFDDCGFGFHAYDLCVPLKSLENIRRHRPEINARACREALIGAYSSAVKREWDADDERMLNLLVVARTIMQLGWISSRLDNPRLRDVYPGFLKRTLAYLRDVKI